MLQLDDDWPEAYIVDKITQLFAVNSFTSPLVWVSVQDNGTVAFWKFDTDNGLQQKEIHPLTVNGACRLNPDAVVVYTDTDRSPMVISLSRQDKVEIEYTDQTLRGHDIKSVHRLSNDFFLVVRHSYIEMFEYEVSMGNPMLGSIANVRHNLPINTKQIVVLDFYTLIIHSDTDMLVMKIKKDKDEQQQEQYSFAITKSFVVPIDAWGLCVVNSDCFAYFTHQEEQYIVVIHNVSTDGTTTLVLPIVADNIAPCVMMWMNADTFVCGYKNGAICVARLPVFVENRININYYDVKDFEQEVASMARLDYAFFVVGGVTGRMQVYEFKQLDVIDRISAPAATQLALLI